MRVRTLIDYHRLSRTLIGTRPNGHESAWESMRVGSGSCVISHNARAIASRDVNKLCCARVPVLLLSSFRTCDWHSSIQTEEMGLSDELVYCFYRLSTRLTEVEQGSQINSRVVKIYLRMLIFTHQIYQQSCNGFDYGFQTNLEKNWALLSHMVWNSIGIS